MKLLNKGLSKPLRKRLCKGGFMKHPSKELSIGLCQAPGGFAKDPSKGFAKPLGVPQIWGNKYTTLAIYY